jgi:hypothetical protein
MTVLKKVMAIALAGVLIWGVGLGCSNSKANTADNDQPPAMTRSSYATENPGASSTPVETKVEPAPSWGADTRKNLETGSETP